MSLDASCWPNGSRSGQRSEGRTLARGPAFKLTQNGTNQHLCPSHSVLLDAQLVTCSVRAPLPLPQTPLRGALGGRVPSPWRFEHRSPTGRSVVTGMCGGEMEQNVEATGLFFVLLFFACALRGIVSRSGPLLSLHRRHGVLDLLGRLKKMRNHQIKKNLLWLISFHTLPKYVTGMCF